MPNANESIGRIGRLDTVSAHCTNMMRNFWQFCEMEAEICFLESELTVLVMVNV